MDGELAPYLIKLFVIFGRTGGVMIAAPILSSTALPMKGRVIFAGMMTLLLYPTIPIDGFAISRSLSLFVAIWGQEFLVGLLIGFAYSIIFAGVQMAGEIMGFQIGYSIVQAVDPLNAAQSVILSIFWNYIAIAIFLIFNGHHEVIRTLVASYQWLPSGGFHFHQTGIDWLIHYTGTLFVIGIQLAGPVLIAVIIVDFVVGFMGRVAPSFNIIVVGFPLKIVVGLGTLGLAMYYFPELIHQGIGTATHAAAKLLQFSR